MRNLMSTQRLVRAARAAARRGLRQSRAEEGFSLVESVMAIGIILVITIGLAATIDTGARGLLTGRQRTTASSVAKEIMERVRAASYDRIGHDATDPNLVSLNDSRLTASGGNQYTYTPTSEPLSMVSDSVMSDLGGSPASYTFTGTDDGTPYQAWVYVTDVTPAVGSGDPHKRATVFVQWTSPATGGLDNTVRLTSRIFPSDDPVRPLVEITTHGNAGSTRASGQLDTTSIVDLTVTNPVSDASLRRLTYADADGAALSHRMTITDDSGQAGTPAGCTSSGNTTTCPAATAQTVADGDPATATDDYDQAGATVPSRTLGPADGDPYAVSVGGGAANSETTTCAGTGCDPDNPAFGSPAQNDAMPQGLTTGQGPSGYSMDMSIGTGDPDGDGDCDEDDDGIEEECDLLTGSIIDSSGTYQAETTLDQTDLAGIEAHKSTATSELQFPDVNVITLDDPTPLGLLGNPIVSVSSFTVTGTAEVGPTAGAADLSGSVVTIDVWEGSALDLGSLTALQIDPGQTEMDQTYSADFTLSLNGSTSSVHTEVRVVAKKADVAGPTTSGGVTTAHVRLQDWLTITADVDIVVDNQTMVDHTVVLDYGDIVIEAEHTEVV